MRACVCVRVCMRRHLRAWWIAPASSPVFLPLFGLNKIKRVKLCDIFVSCCRDVNL